MRCREVLGELRQLGATKVHMPKERETVPCHALYSLPLHPKSYRTTGSADDAKGTAATVGSMVDSHMRFTFTGECVDGSKTA